MRHDPAVAPRSQYDPWSRTGGTRGRYLLGQGHEVEERVACAEAWALALAERLNIPLVPTDHHAFDAIERQRHF